MTRDDVCTCAQYSQCPVCNKSRSNYNELMLEHDELKAENERLKAAGMALAHRVAYDACEGDELEVIDEVCVRCGATTGSPCCARCAHALCMWFLAGVEPEEVTP